MEIVAQVGSASLLRGPASAEEVIEDSASASRSAEHFAEEIKGIVSAPSSRRTTLKSGVTVAVISGAFLGVPENVVGLGYLAESSLGLRVARVFVRVMLHGELAVRTLDLLKLDGASDFQHFVVIPFCHNLDDFLDYIY